MTRATVAGPMTSEGKGDCRCLASLGFGLGVWALVLGVINLVCGAYGSPENKFKVVWAAYLSMGSLYPDLYTADMVFRPYSDTIFLLLGATLTGVCAKCIHDQTEGGFGAWLKCVLLGDHWLSLMSTKESGGTMTAAMWCIVLGMGFYIYRGIVHWNWVDVGVYSVTASLLGFGFALMFAAGAENEE
jgi:hypothetical protein